MSLSDRQQRILGEIEDELAAAEPRLARALAATRLPVLRRRHLVAAGDGPPRTVIAVTVLMGPLLAGIALLAAGVALNIMALICAGAVLGQFGPSAMAYLWVRERRRGKQRRRRLFLALRRGLDLSAQPELLAASATAVHNDDGR